MNILIDLGPDKPIAVVLLRETVVLLPLVLEGAFVQTAGYANVESVAATCKNVCKISPVIHSFAYY
jgi:hypothetical protein